MARERLASTVTTLRHLNMMGSSVERTRRPTEAELISIEEQFVARPRTRTPTMDIVLFALCTCCRVGEIVGDKGVRVEDFLPDERAIWVRNRKSPRTKKANDDKIPLLLGPVTFRGNTVDPVEIILRQPSIRSGCGPIFPFSKWSVQKAFEVACSKAGVVDLHFHDLRHDGISRLFEAGYDIPRVALVSGHKTWKNLQRYTHIDPMSLHRDMTKASDVIIQKP
jgi:integrase